MKSQWSSWTWDNDAYTIVTSYMRSFKNDQPLMFLHSGNVLNARITGTFKQTILDPANRLALFFRLTFDPVTHYMKDGYIIFLSASSVDSWTVDISRYKDGVMSNIVPTASKQILNSIVDWQTIRVSVYTQVDPTIVVEYWNGSAWESWKTCLDVDSNKITSAGYAGFSFWKSSDESLLYKNIKLSKLSSHI